MPDAYLLPECEPQAVQMSRAWAMPNPYTFQIPIIRDFVTRWVDGLDIVIDPFCGSSTIGSHRNDIRNGGPDAAEWLQSLALVADAILLDPPYSPRQISEAYKSIGKPVTQSDTQNARVIKQVRDEAHRLTRAGSVVLSFGWNSCGMGKSRGYTMKEILLVAHGGAHNDTICIAEVRHA
jgi:hypothetical protein